MGPFLAHNCHLPLSERLCGPHPTQSHGEAEGNTARQGLIHHWQ